MAKTTKAKKPTRENELAVVETLLTRLDGYAVPALQLEKSVEECRQLNDQFEHVVVEAIAVETPQHYTDYGSFLRRIKTIEKRLEEQRVEQKATPLEECRRIDAKFKGFAGFAERLRKTFDKAMTLWDNEQEAKRAAEERRLREAARKKQEALDRAAEKKAAKLEAKGKEDEADAVREAVPVISAPVVKQSNVPKVAGVSKTKRYGAEVTAKDIDQQKMRLKQAIDQWNASHEFDLQLIPIEYWGLDVQKIGAMARALKGELKLPNVKIVDSNSRSIRV